MSTYLINKNKLKHPESGYLEQLNVYVFNKITWFFYGTHSRSDEKDAQSGIINLSG